MTRDARAGRANAAFAFVFSLAALIGIGIEALLWGLVLGMRRPSGLRPCTPSTVNPRATRH